ncbi:hypothetical protein BRE01_60440 [Brevibacillus reuszeri]|uniref:Uncharacterized protein n=1 Tax=Brevibacillus reuszeri TaxID=54915 RepID=A0A0K9YNI0_9BACL|nr:hypothetical protein [Brevibacillus reuszeri]KNB70212.1 hypothetical protein ADS79_14685 [Brevibacillus reuszeri]MED1859168.1 hypothetical protein [Brevibacillus reuszeri]GED72342.1 hypothetical protein BRE01_60440 [Brevibacillus reuszeri]
MKQYVLKTVNQNDDVIAESTLSLNEGSILIVKVPDDYTYEQAKNIHEFVGAALEGESKVVIIKESINLQVLEIQ